jgi:hypothetical protein
VFLYEETRVTIRVIEIIDIECVLLSLLSKKIVCTKWPIQKGILVGPRLLRQRNFARLQGVRIVFSTERFAKNFISGLKMEKNFGKEEKVSKNPFQCFFCEKQ